MYQLWLCVYVALGRNLKLSITSYHVCVCVCVRFISCTYVYFIGCLLCMNASVCCCVNSMVEYTALTTPQEGQNIYSVMMWWHVSLCNHLICCGVVWSGHSDVGKGLALYLGSVVTVFLCTHTCTCCNLVVCLCTCPLPHVCALSV